jgi:hypothetical protein
MALTRLIDSESCGGHNGNSRQFGDLRITSNAAKAHDPMLKCGIFLPEVLARKAFLLA